MREWKSVIWIKKGRLALILKCSNELYYTTDTFGGKMEYIFKLSIYTRKEEWGNTKIYGISIPFASLQIGVKYD